MATITPDVLMSLGFVLAFVLAPAATALAVLYLKEFWPRGLVSSLALVFGSVGGAALLVFGQYVGYMNSGRELFTKAEAGAFIALPLLVALISIVGCLMIWHRFWE